MTIDIRQNSFLNEVFQEGRIEGRNEGRNEGRAALLSFQLERRFGTLPEWVQEKLALTQVIDLENWAGRLLDATTLEEVFAGKEPEHIN